MDSIQPHTQSHQLIEDFVRGPLGCNCPDKVFQHIEMTDKPEGFQAVLGNDLYANSQLMNIGGILLVLTVKVEPWERIQDRLQAILKRGIELRDEHGYNRFRLAVATGNQIDAEKLLTQQFEKLAGEDEKVHLHVLSLDQLHSYNP